MHYMFFIVIFRTTLMCAFASSGPWGLCVIFLFCFVFFTDKLVNDTPKMTSSASQPDLLGGWDTWAAGKTASTNAAAKKSSYTNTGELRNIYIATWAWINSKCALWVKEKEPRKFWLWDFCACSFWCTVYVKGQVSDLWSFCRPGKPGIQLAR